MINVLRNKGLALVTVFFGIIYSLISLVNHYFLRTAGWDLGLFNHSIYNYAHFRKDVPYLLQPALTINNSIGDHFDLFTMLISPLYWFHSTYVLLVFQILCILWGGIGVYKFIEAIANKKLALISAIHFFSMWGIYSALGFDYHENVIAATFVPWFIYLIYKERFIYAGIYFLCILFTKENMALWAFFVSLGLALLWFKQPKKVIPSLIFAFVALVYFVLAVKVFIPHFAGNSQTYVHVRFMVLGNNFSEILTTVFTKPFYTFKMLFVNHLGDGSLDGIKVELWVVFLLSGGLVLFFRPQFLLMLLPILGQKLFNDLFVRWGINLHYSIEFAPILTIGAFYILSKVEKSYQLFLGILLAVTCFSTTIWKLDCRKSKWYNPITDRVYDKRHYQKNYDVNKVKDAFKYIPDNASVSAQAMLIPWLAFREKIYHYPYIGDADYIILAPLDENKYYLEKADYDKAINNLKAHGEWIVAFETDEVLIFKRK